MTHETRPNKRFRLHKETLRALRVKTALRTGPQLSSELVSCPDVCSKFFSC